MDVKLKVQSLLVQWVRCFVTAQSSWSGFLVFWFHAVFNSSPLEVFSHPFAFSPRALPPFYQSFLLAWRAVDGSLSRSRSALVMASADPHQFALASSMSAKSAKSIPFGYDYDPNCFCGTLETPSHLFFECALAQSVLGLIQSLMFRASSLCPSLLCCHVLFGFSASELAVVPRVFVYLLNLAKYFLWRARNDYRFHEVRPGALPLMEIIKGRAKCHLVLFFKRFKSSRRQCYFHRQWGANGVVGVVSDGSFYCRP